MLLLSISLYFSLLTCFLVCSIWLACAHSLGLFPILIASCCAFHTSISNRFTLLLLKFALYSLYLSTLICFVLPLSQSYVECYTLIAIAANVDYRLSYSDDCFSILSRARSFRHLKVLEADFFIASSVMCTEGICHVTSSFVKSRIDVK